MGAHMVVRMEIGAYIRKVPIFIGADFTVLYTKHLKVTSCQTPMAPGA